jgi:hypothetical protein
MVTAVVWIARIAASLGAAALVAACAWWAILFPGVMLNTGLGLGQALPCIASDSGMCILAMSLCGARHLFGIHHYSPLLFWIGTIALSLGLMLAGFNGPRFAVQTTFPAKEQRRQS